MSREQECPTCGSPMQAITRQGRPAWRCPWEKPDGSHPERTGFTCEYKPAAAREVSGEFLRGNSQPARGSR